MSNKRQTVWLVSMLSLMVVLSAYYLFTDDAKKKDFTGESLFGDEIGTVDMTDIDGMLNDADAAHDHMSDDEVLSQVSAGAMSGSDYFIALELEREDALSELESKLMEVIASTDEGNNEVSGQAFTELRKLQTLHAKFNEIEDALMADYNYAIVTEENDKYKVTVQTDQLQRSEVVSIIDLVIHNLSVGPDKVLVQYKP